VAITAEVPIIDISPLAGGGEPARAAVSARIGAACRDHGFFYIVGHGVPRSLQESLADLSRRFFALPLEEKLEVAMARGGRAWRGYFPLGQELTSGQPDRKEGIYFGRELSDDHPLVRAATPMHGRNLFPAQPTGWRDVVLEYMEAMTTLGHCLMAGIAHSLGLAETYFHERYTGDPLILFRIFHYPALRGEDVAAGAWGVGEHTDYGVLTILKQDDIGGLEVKVRGAWVAAPPVADAFVVNIGDMLDRMTGGLYRSTPHRVRNPSPRSRYSFPFFFDPNFNAEVHPIEGIEARPDDGEGRWDGARLDELSGTYGEYLLAKVSRVFPELRATALSSREESFSGG